MKYIVRFIYALFLLGMLLFTLPFAIVVNLVMYFDSFITSTYRLYKRKRN